MNKGSIVIFALLVSVSGYAQKVSVAGQTEKVKGESVEGYGTELEGKKDGVTTAWIKFLKDIGKVRQVSDPITVSEPAFNGLSFSKGVIYSIVKDKGEKTTVWLGVVPAEWETNDVKRINNELEKALSRFGVKYYRDKIQVQIDEAQQALVAVEKQKQRLTNQTKDLTLQLSNNEQEKAQLDKSIEVNTLEHATLKVRLQNNTKAQDSLTQAATQIEKVRLMHVDRQKKVN